VTISVCIALPTHGSQGKYFSKTTGESNSTVLALANLAILKRYDYNCSYHIEQGSQCKNLCKTTDEGDCRVLAIATMENATKIYIFMFVSHLSRYRMQVLFQYNL
jgi:hypothetical protein